MIKTISAITVFSYKRTEKDIFTEINTSFLSRREGSNKILFKINSVP